MFTNFYQLREDIKRWGLALGFQQVGISHLDLLQAEQHLQQWLAKQYQGDMQYMSHHGLKRSRPTELVPGTLSIISVRMNYLCESQMEMQSLLGKSQFAYISRYALGKDYHKLMRQRLKKLAEQIAQHIGEFQYRVFTDSAPVLEKPLAEQAGLGWIGKHTNLIHRAAGSWFFLGEIYTDLPLPTDESPQQNHCGRCHACIDVCPTQAIVAPYQLDARRCISYLTIEHHGAIPKTLRPLLGNRIYGCDDCQLFCPWNRFAQLTAEADFFPRHDLHCADLLSLFAWDEETFLKRLEGSPIRRIGHVRWLRNIAVALGNSADVRARPALQQQLEHPEPLVREHVRWALDQLDLLCG